MKLTRLDAWPIRIPRDMSAATGTAGSPTTLTAGTGDYRWSTVYPALYSVNFETALIRLTTSDGLTGWGEAQAPLAPEIACDIVRLLLTPAIIGQEFHGTRKEIETLWDRMYSTMRVRGQTAGFMMDAISAVDMALWDLAGKMAGKPVSALLANEPAKRIPAYLSGLPSATRVETARRFRDDGFDLVKLFYDTPDRDTFLAQTDEVLPLLKVAVDALWRFSLEEAITFGHELDRRGAVWFEAPLLPERAEDHAALARALKTPIAIGESYRTRFEMRPFFEAEALTVFQPDLGRCGITEGLRLAAEAQHHDAAVVPHISIALGPQIAAALHFAAAAPGCDLTEYNPQVLTVANRFLHEPIRMEGNCYVVPQGPGLGIEINESVLPS